MPARYLRGFAGAAFGPGRETGVGKMVEEEASMKLVAFAHGKESGPWGVKSLALAEVARRCGWRFLSPDLRAAADPDERVGLLCEAVPDDAGPLVLVGSSMGGYVATRASTQLHPAALLLLAPAFYLPGYRDQDPRPEAERVVVVHGRDDALIPPAHAWRFASRHGAEFHLLADDHPLRASIPFLEQLLAGLLAEIAPGSRLAPHL